MIEKNHILIVDDNLINQTVAREILENAGYKTSVVDNGALALKAVQEKNFAAVLMDIQMPVMDGHTATRKIRELPCGKALPIIAMTANAMVSDCEQCLASGMDDYVTKPMSIDRVVNTLKKWIGSNPTADTPEQHAPNQQAPALPDSSQSTKHSKPAKTTISLPKNLPGISLEWGLFNCSQNVDFYLKLLKELADNYGHQAQNIPHLIQQERFEEASAIIHSIKGVSGNLGATALHYASTQLEQSLRNDDHAGIDITSQVFTQILEDLVATIRHLSEQYASA